MQLFFNFHNIVCANMQNKFFPLDTMINKVCTIFFILVEMYLVNSNIYKAKISSQFFSSL